jgi:multidrug efflux system membrane fusion protein
MAGFLLDIPPQERVRSRVSLHKHLIVASCGVLLSACASGCQQKAAQSAAPELPVIPVSRPIAREITDFVYYTGRADAVQSVDIRARVTGYLTKLLFKEGSEVKEGDVLFEIDPRPYQAQYENAKAQADLKEASYRLAHSESVRSQAISRNVSGSISPEAIEKSLSQEAQALADWNAAKATLELAKLDLDFTKVTSPIEGHIGRYNLTLGNLVTMDQTLLTSVVSVDPMYAYFDMDQRTVLRIRNAINEGKIRPARDTNEIPVNMGLEGEEGYPHHGNLNFVNNTLSLSTGTITVRGVFANPKPENGRRLLTPGMFLRIQFPIGQPHPSLLINDRAVGSDQGVKYVYVVDEKHTVQYRRITPGELQDDGLRAVDAGLKPGDWVVIGGLQLVRPGMKVEPEPTTMPSFSTPAAPAPVPAPGPARPEARPPAKAGQG